MSKTHKFPLAGNHDGVINLNKLLTFKKPDRLNIIWIRPCLHLLIITYTKCIYKETWSKLSFWSVTQVNRQRQCLAHASRLLSILVAWIRTSVSSVSDGQGLHFGFSKYLKISEKDPNLSLTMVGGEREKVCKFGRSRIGN